MASIKWQRQQILELVVGALAFGRGEDDFEVAAELPENLPAGAARRRGRVLEGDGDPAELAMAFRERLEHRDTLGADGQAVGRVLDVAAGDDGPVFGLQGGAHLEI